MVNIAAAGRGIAREPGWRPVVASHDVGRWDDEADAILVGSGASALVAGVMAATGGASVIALEKAAETGGTARKSGGNSWVPRNHHMQGLGLVDSRDGALRYMARTARPQLYSPDAPSLGLPQWEYDGICLFVDEGAKAFAELEQIGAFATLPLRDSRKGNPFDGGAMPAVGADDRHVIKGETLQRLAEAIDERLAALARATGGLRLTPDFTPQLAASVARFNEFARNGHDDDFAGNPTMAPLADKGPYYSVILAPGMLDTKGGPRTDGHRRVLTSGSVPIPGLCAVGNCAASPTGRAYWGGGSTLGPMITFAWLAGRHAATCEPVPILAGSRTTEGERQS